MDFDPRLSVATHLCHSRKGGNPGVTNGLWIPAFARMIIEVIFDFLLRGLSVPYSNPCTFVVHGGLFIKRISGKFVTEPTLKE